MLIPVWDISQNAALDKRYPSYKDSPTKTPTKTYFKRENHLWIRHTSQKAERDTTQAIDHLILPGYTAPNMIPILKPTRKISYS